MEQFRDMDVEVWPVNEKVLVATMGVWKLEIVNRIKEAQKDNPELQRIIEHIDDMREFRSIDGILYCKDRLYVRCSRHQVRADDRCAPHQILYSPEEGKNVSEFEESLFVGENEERDCIIRFQVYGLLVD